MSIRYGNISMIGRRHIESNELCQDRSISGEILCPFSDENGESKVDHVYFLAVADGVGSEIHSGIGAGYAITLIMNNVQKLYRNIVLRRDHDRANVMKKKFLKFIRASAEAFAESIGTTKEAMATTLSFAIMGSERTFVLSLGDSPICVKLKGQPLVRITGNITDGFANQTVSAFSSCSWDVSYAEVFKTSEIESVFVVSDGADILCRPKKVEDSLDWIEGMVSGEDTLQSIAKQIVDLQRDDVSIAYIYRN